MQLLLMRTKAKATLLEIGCGSGRILASIRARDKDLDLTGLDMSHEQIKAAIRENRSQEIDFIWGDGQSLPFEGEQFDYVIIMDFLEHIPSPSLALGEAWRVLKPNGHLHAFIPAEGQPFSIYWICQKILGRHIKESTVGHIQQFTFERLERMIGQWFKIIDRKYSYHFLGSLMDYCLFALLLSKRLSSLFWSSNKYYLGAKGSRSTSARILNAAMTAGNAIAFCESRLLRNTRVSATGIHLTAIKTSGDVSHI